MQSRTRARSAIRSSTSCSERRSMDWITTPQCAPYGSEEPLGEEVEGALGVVGAFHVEPDEPAERLRLVEDAHHVGVAELLADVEAHLGELDRDVDLDAARRHPVEHLQVEVARGGRLGLGGHALAQQVERAA